MTFTDVVSIRLPAGKRFLYEKEAAHQGQSLGVYLRERLEQSESLSQQPSASPTPPSSHEQGVLLEVLLLLRYLSSPEKMLIVQRELERLNIPVWQGDGLPGRPKHGT
jgi:hypothetical protein